jgi:hypothetical protein
LALLLFFGIRDQALSEPLIINMMTKPGGMFPGDSKNLASWTFSVDYRRSRLIIPDSRAQLTDYCP